MIAHMPSMLPVCIHTYIAVVVLHEPAERVAEEVRLREL